MEAPPAGVELSEAIVERVFQYLRLADRKNGRLVCRLWHSAACRTAICRTEAIYVSSLYGLYWIVEILEKSRRQCLQLRFGQRVLNSKSDLLWQRCGPRIRSLEFLQCDFLPGVLRTIFQRCDRLTEFVARGGRIKRRFDIQIEYSFLLNVPRNERLTKLHLGSAGFRFCSRDLALIAPSFPRLRSLKMYLRVSDNLRYEDGPINFSKLGTVIGELPHLRSLSLTLLPQVWDHPHIDLADMPAEFSQLRSLCMPLAPFLLTGKSLGSIGQYRFWTNVSMDLGTLHESPELVVLLVRLLGSNHQLQGLELAVTLEQLRIQQCYLSVILKAVIRSRLRSFSLSTHGQLPFGYMADIEEIMQLGPSEVNRSLRKLRIASQSEDFCSLLVKHCPNVRRLWALPGDVNEIFGHLRCLEFLEVDVTYYQPPRLQPASRLVESVEMLVVSPQQVDLWHTYRFPNLKFLFYNDRMFVAERPKKWKGRPLTPPTRTTVWKLRSLWEALARWSPQLEGVGFLFQNPAVEACIPLDFFDNYASRFPKLRFLGMTDLGLTAAGLIPQCLRRDARNCMLAHPQLSSIWIDTPDHRCEYFRNPISGSVEFPKKFAKNIPDIAAFSIDKFFYDYWRHGR